MKKLIILLILLTGFVWGQNRNILDSGNSTSDTLSGGPIASISLEGTADSIWVHDSGTSVAAGDVVLITGTGDGNYDTQHTVLEADVDSFMVAATYTATGTGFYGQIYTGTSRDLLVINRPFASILIKTYNSHTGAITCTLQVQFSQDNSNWDKTYSRTVADETDTTFAFRVEGRYYRVKYFNVRITQTAFRLSSILHLEDMTGGMVLSNSVPSEPLYVKEVLDTDLTRLDTVLNAGNTITTLSALLSSVNLIGGGFTITNEQSGESIAVGSSATNTGVGSTNSGDILLYKEAFYDWINFYTTSADVYIKGSAATTMFRLKLAYK